jgi:hypothetical protein
MFRIMLDLSALQQLAERFDPKAIESLGKKTAHDLAAATHAHIIEQANAKLHSRLKPFLDGIKFSAENEDTWVIILDKSVRWIDDGMDPHSMVEYLLTEKPGSKGKVRTAADGSRFRVIPFNHGPGKGATTTTPAQQSLISTIKAEMKTRNIPFGKIEKDEGGAPKTGMLHSFDIMRAPLKTVGFGARGQGWGPVGAVKQGPTGIPFLQGVRVYQNPVKDKAGKETVKRSVMTFRIVSSKHSGGGRWFHPGLPPEHIFDEAAQWAQKEWETHAMPALLEALQSGRVR